MVREAFGASTWRRPKNHFRVFAFSQPPALSAGQSFGIGRGADPRSASRLRELRVNPIRDPCSRGESWRLPKKKPPTGLGEHRRRDPHWGARGSIGDRLARVEHKLLDAVEFVGSLERDERLSHVGAAVEHNLLGDHHQPVDEELGLRERDDLLGGQQTKPPPTTRSGRCRSTTSGARSNGASGCPGSPPARSSRRSG